MDSNEICQIHALFEAGNYRELYQTQKTVLHEMLLIQTPEEFADFLQQEGSIDETIFFLYYAAAHGERLLIGGYEGNISKKVVAFLQAKLPEAVFNGIQEDLSRLSVDIDGKNNLREILDDCNRQMAQSGYALALEQEDTYCAGAYFLFVDRLPSCTFFSGEYT